MDKIFVQIASYRDPELIPTVLDLVDTCTNPKNLRIVIGWQHDDHESLEPIKHLVEFLDIPYVESRGVCWVRNLIQQKYNGEKYTLHLDSHHRFVKGWDVSLINMYNQCKQLGSSLPLLTSYLPSFDPYTDTFYKEAWKINASKFIDDGILFCVPGIIDNFESLSTPIKAKFYSGHFAFTDGEFSKKVMHDPEYYFYGEETNIGVRAFTHGYDLYHPHRILGWHQYNRNYRPLHWNDHSNLSAVETEWSKLDEISKKKYKNLFGITKSSASTKNNKYGFGTKRTLKDYEKFAGIKFSTKYISNPILDTSL